MYCTIVATDNIFIKIFCVELELVDRFCCLVYMLTVDGDADAAVEARI